MHRTMIMIVNKILADEGNINYPWVQGWRYLPKPLDQSYPVPPAYNSHRIPRKRLELEKSVERYWSYFSGLEKKFTDSDYLSSVTLDSLVLILNLQFIIVCTYDGQKNRKLVI